MKEKTICFSFSIAQERLKMKKREILLPKTMKESRINFLF